MARPLLLPGDRPMLHLALLGATVVTTFFAGLYQFSGGRPDEALVYSLSAIAILGCHEMGHYVSARLHGVNTTLPYFIPLPALGFGTLGAVIRLRSPIPSRNALVDIGAAGPLAGLAVAIPLIAWGLSNSTLVDVPAAAADTFPGRQSALVLGAELWAYLRDRMTGVWAGGESRLFGVQYGDNLLMKGLIRLVIGEVPAGQDVLLHPAAIAGWFGLFITTLNLCPIGQLDGGHLAFAMFGRGARWIGRAMAAILLYLVVFHSITWLLWLIVSTTFIGFRHPAVVHPGEPLSAGRKWICLLCLVALVLCMIPVPIRLVVTP